MAAADVAPEGAKLADAPTDATEAPAADASSAKGAAEVAEKAPATDAHVAVPGEDLSMGEEAEQRRIDRRSSEPAYLALEQTLQERRKEHEFLKFDEARDLLWEALEADRGPQEGRPLVRSLCFTIGRGLLAAIVLLLLLLLTRSLFTEVVARDGLLLGAGEEPVAALAVARESRSVTAAAALTPSILRNVRDVSLVHQGVWRCLHISGVTKYSDWHIWMEAADGSGVRVRGGKAFLRIGFLGDEEELQPSEDFLLNESSNASNWTASVADAGVEPTAFFDLILSI